MRRILKKSIVFIGGVFATIGITISNAPAHNIPAKTTTIIQNIKKSTPLYLEHASKLFLKKNLLTWHYSHSSHESHSSHVSHYSHYSGG